VDERRLLGGVVLLVWLVDRNKLFLFLERYCVFSPESETYDVVLATASGGL